MPSFMISFALVFFAVVAASGQNYTSPRRSGHHRDANTLAALQQIQTQLGGLETDNQRQAIALQELARTSARLEAQRQELVQALDRSEARLSQRLDDIKGNVLKVITLQDVMREDIDKIQQNQLVNKLSLEEQLRQVDGRRTSSHTDTSLDHSAVHYQATDILSNLQIVQTTLHALRRMSDTMQTSINVLRSNVTDVANLTRSIRDFEKDTALTKGYFQSALQSLMEEKSNNVPIFSCVNSIQNTDPEEHLPRDCKEVQDQMQNKSGIYRIRMKYSLRPIFVYCDMETDGGGWTVIQKRQDGSVDFLREWSDYKHGFGNVGGEFWLGNENLYLLTHQDLYELRVDLYDFDDGHAFSTYGGFAVGSEKEKYMLKLLGALVGGDAGDGLTYHASIPFSTIDVDNDRWEGGHCAKDHTGGWWYNQCDASNLNGRYLRGLTQDEYQGVYWHEWQGPSYSLLATRMMVRPMGAGGWKPPVVNATSKETDIMSLEYDERI